MGANCGSNSQKRTQGKNGTTKSVRSRAAKRRKPEEPSSAESSFIESSNVDHTDIRVLRGFKQLDATRGVEGMLQQMHLSNHVSTYKLRNELSSFRAEVGVRFAKVEERVEELESFIAEFEDQLESMGQDLKSLKHEQARSGSFAVANKTITDKREKVQQLLEGTRRLREDTMTLRNTVVFGLVKNKSNVAADPNGGEGNNLLERDLAGGVNNDVVLQSKKGVDAKLFEAEIRGYLTEIELDGKYRFVPRSRDGLVAAVVFEDDSEMSGVLRAKVVMEQRMKLRNERGIWVNFDVPEKVRLAHSRALRFAFEAKKRLRLHFRFIDDVLILGDLVIGPEQLIPPEGKGWDLLMKLILESMMQPFILYDDLLPPLDQTHPLVFGFLIDFRLKPFEFESSD